MFLFGVQRLRVSDYYYVGSGDNDHRDGGDDHNDNYHDNHYLDFDYDNTRTYGKVYE